MAMSIWFARNNTSTTDDKGPSTNGIGGLRVHQTNLTRVVNFDEPLDCDTHRKRRAKKGGTRRRWKDIRKTGKWISLSI